MKQTYFLLAALSLATAALGQTRVYVAEGATGTGASWGSPTGDLAGVMASAAPNTEIWVKQGTYYPGACAANPCTDAERNTSFDLREGVTVIGGFTGVETAASEADPGNVTTLSGDIGAAGDPSDNAYNVVRCSGCGSAAGMANFTITGGLANRMTGFGGRLGAGVFIKDDQTVASPTFTACSIVGNESSEQGGGVYFDGFRGTLAPTFTRCLIAGNTSANDGGGLYAASNDSDVRPTFSESIIRDNFSGGSGGGMFASSLSGGTIVVTLDRVLFAGNAAAVPPGSTVSANSGANGGGMYFKSGGAVTDVRLVANNSSFAKNFSFSGAAIYNKDATATLTNVTVTGNRAVGNGGSGAGLYVNGGVATVVNSLFHDNEIPNNPGAGRDFRFVNGTIDASYTLLAAADRDEAFSRAGNDNADVFNDGPGLIYGQSPQLVDASAEVPLLTASSPAVDAGLTASAAGPLDYYGDARVNNGTVDLGATEYSAPFPVTLVRFAAAEHGGAVEVTWASAGEEDLAGFDLYRSADGRGFERLGRTPATGDGDYAYTDTRVTSGVTYYYRLRGVDFDGTGYDSDIVSVSVGGAGANALSLQAFPNPVSDDLRLRWDGGRSPGGATRATLLDLTGRRIAEWPLSGSEAILPLGAVMSGLYVLRVEGAAGVVTSPITVSR